MTQNFPLEFVFLRLIFYFDAGLASEQFAFLDLANVLFLDFSERSVSYAFRVGWS